MTENPRNRFSAARKACTALVVGALLITGAGCASHGNGENPAAAVTGQIHDSQASSGTLNGHSTASKGGLITVTATAVAKAEPAVVPVAAPHDENDRIGTISIPALGRDWTRFLVEGGKDGVDSQLGQPGTDDPNAVADQKTAIVRTHGTQNLGDFGNVGVQGHRTDHTLAKINTLQHGDQILVTDAKTGTIYTYAVTQTVRDNPHTIAYLGTQQGNPDTEERGLPFGTKPDRDKSSAVMDPIPFDDNSISTPGHPATNPAKDRLLTLTSCGIYPPTTSDWRVYVIAKLQSVNGVNV